MRTPIAPPDPADQDNQVAGSKLAAKAVLLAAGLVLAWHVAQYSQTETVSYVIPAIAALTLFVRPVREVIVRVGNQLRDANGRAQWMMFVAVWIGATAYLYFTAWRQQRYFGHIWHDESSYLVMARLMSHGRLWMPSPPAADSFETFYVLVRPVYTSIYFVGTGVVYLPAMLLDLPPWVISLFIAGLIPAVLLRVLTTLFNPAAALVGSLTPLALMPFRTFSIRMLANEPAMLMCLGLLAAWLAWWRTLQLRWVLLMGILAGWVLVTRPLDGVAIASLLGISVLWRLRKAQWQTWLATITAGILSTCPFLVLQAVHNHAVTGSWTTTAWTYWCDRDYPNSALGFHPYDPAAEPQSQLPQIRVMYDTWLRPMLKEHTHANAWNDFWTTRLPTVARSALPMPGMIALLPLALLALRDVRRTIVMAFAPVFIAIYMLFYYLPPQHAMMIAPALTMAALAAVQVLSTGWRWPARRIEPLLLFVLLAVIVGQLPEVTQREDDPLYFQLEGVAIETRLAEVPAPALVLFRYSPDVQPHIEPVFQIGSASPHDAPVARAHDLGAVQNLRLLRTYVQSDPDRSVWLYDRGGNSLQRLGTVEELLESGGAPW